MAHGPVWRHGEVHLGRAPGALVPHEAAAQGVVLLPFFAFAPFESGDYGP